MEKQSGPKPRVALIVGAGISCESMLPSTKEITTQFLDSLPDRDIPIQVQQDISRHLRNFWTEVFSYAGGDCRPSLEDHFTAIDLAANTGHHLGPFYSPSKLRAIRRMSIHRVFHILDSKYEYSQAIATLIDILTARTELSIVSLNWDVVLENHFSHLAREYDYGLALRPLIPVINRPVSDTRLHKLHGSANWVYCDSCRTLFHGPPRGGKDAMRLGAYLEPRDFQLLQSPKNVQDILQLLVNDGIACRICGCRMSGRVGTFSYRKDYAIQQLQAIWHDAFDVLRKSPVWLFIGYSMPEADFEFKQILKSAELADRSESGRHVQVVLKDDPDATARYRKFFGLKRSSFAEHGLSAWMSEKFDSWFRQII